MFSKFLKNTSKDTENISNSVDVPKNGKNITSHFSRADVVFGLGILMIILAVMYILSNMGEKSVEKVSDLSLGMAQAEKMSPPPYEVYTKKEAPWQEKEKKRVEKKDIEAVANNTPNHPSPAPFENYVQPKEPWYEQNKHTNSAIGKIQVFENKKHEQAKKRKEKKKVKDSSSYVCSVLPIFKDFIAKEIVYYVQKKENAKVHYIPAYLLASWDEKGMVIKKKFIASDIDIDKEMVEIDNKYWIPALKFASCILVGGTE